VSTLSAITETLPDDLTFGYTLGFWRGSTYNLDIEQGL